jgi:hypothetical protein
MLQCVDCGRHSTVDDPTADEWKRAFHAPSRPYRWDDESRIALRHKSAPYVVRGTDAWRCDCCRCPAERPEYERFPAEIARRSKPLTEEETAELKLLVDLVERSGELCSLLFPFFIHSFQQDTGREVPGAVRRIAKQIENLHDKGLHMSPGVVAEVLRTYGALQS